MNPLSDMSRMLILIGIIIVGMGLLLSTFSKIPYLGRLPGDILIQRKNFSFYFPITTCLLLSLLLSLVFWLFGRK